MEGNTGFQEPPQRQEFQRERKILESTESGWLMRLKNRFNKILRREPRFAETFPKISIDIFYAPHNEPEDLAGLKRKIKYSDILIPEMANWTQSIQEISNRVSFGKVAPEDATHELKVANDPYWVEFYKEIYNSSKPVVFIDTPADSSQYKEMIRNKNIPLEGDFNEFISGAFKRFLELEANSHKEREEFMVFQLDARIRKVLKEYPSLKQKDSLNILLSLGSVHTPLYFILRKMGKEVRREFNIMPTVFGFRDEAVRRYRFDKKVDDELLARAFIDTVFRQPLIKLLIYKTKRNIDLNKRQAFTRKVISQFTSQDARELFDALKEGQLEGRGREKVNKLFVGKLLEKRIIIPQSNTDLDEFLAKPLPPRPNSP